MEREALKLALEALELVDTEFVCNGAHHAKKDRHQLGESCPIVERYQEAIVKVKATLAQPAQDWKTLPKKDAPLVEWAKEQTPPAAQPAQEPLACIRSLIDQCAALIGERDELQKQVWRYEKNGVTCQTYGHKIDSSCSECNVHENYTTPPKRPWVGLTEEDRKAALLKSFIEWECEELLFCAREDYLLIEQALKEKNNG